MLIGSLGIQIRYGRKCYQKEVNEGNDNDKTRKGDIEGRLEDQPIKYLLVYNQIIKTWIMKEKVVEEAAENNGMAFTEQKPDGR